jgi:glycosyltransferase involved in cell wall biosynthesis
LSLPPDLPMFLFFGTLRRDKGPDVLLEALRQLPGNWVTVIAGRPDYVGREELERELIGRGQLILRLGHIPSSEILDYFAAADAVILPYRATFSGTSGVLQRAAAAGKPVIVTDVGDIGPLVRDRSLGSVVPPESPRALANAMAEFVSKRTEAVEQVGPRALRYAAETEWRVLGKKVREAYARATRLGRPEGSG